jgi:hypothetical protein
MGHVKRDRDPRDVIRRKPVIRQPKVRPKAESTVFELPIELLDPCLKLGPLNPHIEITHPQIEELLIGPIRPRGLG